MPFFVFKSIDLESIGAGSTVEKTWTSDDDYILKRMYIIETSETAVGLQFLKVTFWIDNTPYVKDFVNAKVFEGYKNQQVELNLPLSKGKTFKISVSNIHSTSAISAHLVLELWKE